MRMLMKVQIPTPAGNDAIREGVLPGVMKAATDSLGAEAVYFTAEEGMRTALIFFEMRDASWIPPAAEPFFMALQAKITLVPVMNFDEMQSGVGRAMAQASMAA